MTDSKNPSQSSPKFKILLAEDNLVNRVLAQKLLQKNGHTVTTANNGREATARWDENRSNQFDLLLMDIQMPTMDGLQATAYIRAREEILSAESATNVGVRLHVPIVAMTAHAMKGDRERYIAGGMDGYVSKPINSTELEHVIQSVVASFAPEISSPAPAVESVKKAMPRGIEEAQILARFDRDVELTRDLAEMFINECPRHLSAIHAAIRDRNARALEHSAHALKGSVGNFSTSGAHESAVKLEMLGKSGSVVGAPEILKVLEEQLAKFNQLLSGMTKEMAPP
jgi:two-component system, sensor histidine kinase and response regulator